MHSVYADPSWESYYRSRPRGRYPSEEAVRFFMARSPKDHAPRVLDIGAGAGALAWFMAKQGADVVALEGAPAALRQLADTLRFFGVEERVESVAGDIMRPSSHVSGSFDLLVDHYSLYANHETRLRASLREYLQLLAPGGSMLSCMFGVGCSGLETGMRIAPNTWQDVAAGAHAGMTPVSLWTEAEAIELYRSAGFAVLATENLVHRRGELTTEKLILHLGRG